MGEFVKCKHRVALMMVFQCSVVTFPLLTAALKEYASDSAIKPELRLETPAL